jgi:hypothetical protein
MKRMLATLVVTVLSTSLGPVAGGQSQAHLPPASGIPHGIPRICVDATVRSVANGAWSNAATWSTGRVPEAGDAVLVQRSTKVTYDVASDTVVACVDVEGSLTFRGDVDTRLMVGTITVLESGRLEIGTEQAPIAAHARAELVFADHRIDATRDPEQLTAGLLGLGTVRMHGAVKAATFARVTAEPLAGQTTLRMQGAISGWSPGDKLVLPDTRQLRDSQQGSNYRPQWEEVTIAGLSGTTVTLSAPLRFDHKGARRPDGALEFLPHAGNVSRNVIVRSENARGTRGHVIFIGRPDVDIRYALFEDLGRTRLGPLDNTEIAPDGSVRHVGTNQIGRYSLHFHHAFGPIAPPPTGYQFTLVGNAIDGASKWGIAIHHSHYGLIRDNIVYNSRGAGIVAEDGTESFNVFEHNFALRSEGSGEFAPRSGYGGTTDDPGGEGAGFWLRGPNNILRRNVAANAGVFGFGIAAGGLGTVRIPKFKGADTSRDGEYTLIDTTDAPLLEFTSNEAYGAMQTGVAIGWNGTLKDSRVWHTSRYALAAFPADRLSIDGVVALGDVAVLQGALENPIGVWFTNYAAKRVSIRDADIQGMRVGVESPFFPRMDNEPGRADGVATIADSYFRNYVGVALATAYTAPVGRGPAKKAIIRNSRFDALKVPEGQYAPAAISMNYGVSTGDTVHRDPVLVYDFNGKSGDTFRVYYSFGLPASAAPACHSARPEIVGFVCVGEEIAQAPRR